VDVPELGYLMIDGEGSRNDPGFQQAMEALYAAMRPASIPSAP
jgi:hypothetical protein